MAQVHLKFRPPPPPIWSTLVRYFFPMWQLPSSEFVKLPIKLGNSTDSPVMRYVCQASNSHISANDIVSY
jgi:hypothetical protein